jgi:hypothetical protein
MRHAYNILVGKPERKRALGRPRRRWEKMQAVRLYMTESVLRS